MNNSQNIKEVVVIDPGVTDYETLISGLSPEIPVILLQGGTDGLMALAQALSGYTNLDAVHLVSHGSQGQLLLSDDVIDQDALARQSDTLANIAQSFAPGADLLLYGCSVAAGEDGQSFVEQLASSLGVDIAASDDKTGPLSLGGDWALEFNEGSIESVLPFTVQGMQDMDHCLGCSFPEISWKDLCELHSGTWNYPPTNITLSDSTVLHSEGFADIEVGELSTTDSDSGPNFTYTLVSGTGDTDNDLFHIVGNELRANSPAGMAGGSYNIRIQTHDGRDAYSKAFTITVVDDVDLSIAVSGTPAANADTIEYTVTFDNSVTGVDVSDFVLTTTSGTATGNITGVSGSGNTYTVTVDTLTGAGGLRLDLKDSGTDIDDGSGTPLGAYTSGEIHVVDKAGPVVTAVAVPADDTYTAGDTLDFTLVFDEDVILTGTSSVLVLMVGGRLVLAPYQGHTADSITYRYTVQANDLDTDGISVDGFVLNGDTLRDSAGNDADMTPNNIGSTTAILIDAVPPGVPTGILSVDENSINSTVVGTVTSTDAVAFALTDDAGGRFAIDNNGNVTVADGSLLDRETDASHAIRVQATDSASNISSETLSVTVNNVNEAPEISSAPTLASGTSTDYTFTAADFNFADVDGDTLHSVIITAVTRGTVKLNGNDISTVLPQTITRAQLDNGELTLAPVDSSDQTFTYKVFDGALESAAETMTVTVNNTPSLVGLDNTPAYTEGAAAVVLDADVTVADVEMDALNGATGDYSGATLTVSRSGGASSHDEFSSELGLTEGGVLSISSTAVAAVTQNSNGTLVLTFNGDATTAMVQQALQSIQYRNISDAPASTVQLDYGFSDGISAGTGSITVAVTGVNDAPVFTGVDATPAFTENGSAVVLDGNFTLADPELDALNNGLGNYEGATFKLERDTAANAEDEFSATGTLSALTEGQDLILDGTTVGTVTTNSGGTLLLSFNSAATTVLVNSVLQKIAYSNASDTPPGSVQINYTFDDGNTGAQGSGGRLSDSDDSIIISLTAVNDKPVLSNLSGDQHSNYRANDGAILIDRNGDVVVTDPDSADFDSGVLTVAVTTGLVTTEDVLAIKDTGTNAGEIGLSGTDVQYGGITIGIVAGGTAGIPLTITLNSSATAASVAALVSQITYENTAASPTKTTRTVEFVLTDGDTGTSDTASATVGFYVAPPPPNPEPAPQPEPPSADQDINGDGIPDVEQDKVAGLTLRGTNGEAIRIGLVAGEGSKISAFQQLQGTDVKGLSMPLGLISFDAEIEQPGGSETFSLYVDDSQIINGYWKQNAAGNWVNLASAEYGGRFVLEGDKLRLDFELTDGGEFDRDKEANGVIQDPGALGFGSDTFSEQVQALYIAYYQRPADSGGMAYWRGQLEQQNGDLSGIVDAFATSAESQALHGDIINTSVSGFIGDLYRAMFDRAPEVSGLMFYRNAFLNGAYEDGRPATVGTLILDILQGAQGEDAAAIANKLDAAQMFTWLLDPDADGEVQASFDAGDLDIVRQWLQGITTDTEAPGTGTIYGLIREEVAGVGDPITLVGAGGVSELLF